MTSSSGTNRTSTNRRKKTINPENYLYSKGNEVLQAYYKHKIYGTDTKTDFHNHVNKAYENFKLGQVSSHFRKEVKHQAATKTKKAEGNINEVPSLTLMLMKKLVSRGVFRTQRSYNIIEDSFDVFPQTTNNKMHRRYINISFMLEHSINSYYLEYIVIKFKESTKSGKGGKGDTWQNKTVGYISASRSSGSDYIYKHSLPNQFPIKRALVCMVAALSALNDIAVRSKLVVNGISTVIKYHSPDNPKLHQRVVISPFALMPIPNQQQQQQPNEPPLPPLQPAGPPIQHLQDNLWFD